MASHELTQNEQAKAKPQPTHPSKRKKDPKHFITPFAFSVAPKLYGIALGSPTKRAVAIVIDLFVVLLLSELSSSVLAALMAIVFWKVSRQFTLANEKPVLRIALRVAASLLLFSLALFYFPWLESYKPSNADDSAVNFDLGEKEGPASQLLKGGVMAAAMLQQMELIKETKLAIKNGDCASSNDCWQDVFDDFSSILIELKATPSAAKELMNSLMDEAELSAKERQQIQQRLPQAYQVFISPERKETSPELGENSPERKEDGPERKEDGPDQNASPEDTKKPSKQVDGAKPEVSKNSDPESTANSSLVGGKIEGGDNNSEVKASDGLLAYFHGLLLDLGLGFGWAAFYFTVLTAWFTGQTPGKYLLGLKVIKLNGEQMNLWESFGRYGGYGAGLATGLTGFMQILWDPNRQAIQDKISETLVIDLRKSRQPWPDRNAD